MVEDIIILKYSVAIVVEVNADLFAGVDAVASEHGGGAGSDPDAGQRVGVNFVLLDQPLTLFVYVDAAVLTVVNLVVTNDRIAGGGRRESGKGYKCKF